MSDPITRSLHLVARAQEGDRQALERLLERYYPRVLQVVRIRLGSRLRESLDSGDIVQDTLCAAIRAFPSFEMRDEASLMHWLAKLVERQIFAQADYHGAAKRAAALRVPLDASPSGSQSTGHVGQQHADTATTPLDRLQNEEERGLLLRAMDELEPDLRELIVQRNYLGASWETIAELTGSPSAAAARMRHARAKLELAKRLRALGLDVAPDATLE